jgi:hypothetical protein
LVAAVDPQEMMVNTVESHAIPTARALLMRTSDGDECTAAISNDDFDAHSRRR